MPRTHKEDRQQRRPVPSHGRAGVGIPRGQASALAPWPGHIPYLSAPGITMGRWECPSSPDRGLSGTVGCQGQWECSLPWAQEGPPCDPLQARPQGDRGQRDKHTRHHHATIPEK